MTKNSETVSGFPAGKHWCRAKDDDFIPVFDSADTRLPAARRREAESPATSSGDVSRRRKRLEVGNISVLTFPFMVQHSVSQANRDTVSSRFSW